MINIGIEVLLIKDYPHSKDFKDDPYSIEVTKATLDKDTTADSISEQFHKNRMPSPDTVSTFIVNQILNSALEDNETDNRKRRIYMIWMKESFGGL